MEFLARLASKTTGDVKEREIPEDAPSHDKSCGLKGTELTWVEVGLNPLAQTHHQNSPGADAKMSTLHSSPPEVDGLARPGYQALRLERLVLS
jgi:hypothetical protein